MENEKLLNEMRSILEVDALELDSILDDYEMWDSFARLSLLTFLEDEGFSALSDEEFAEASTPRAILKMIEA